MKKLMLVTDESVLAGCARSGVAEVADSLANAMAADYAVSVVCPDGNGVFIRMAANLRQVADGVRACRLFGVDYYLLRHWPDGLSDVASMVGPDVLHNFAAPELLGALPTRPARCVYTIDQADFARGKENALAAYDAATTVSKAYAAELLSGGDSLAETLADMDFRGITNGILTPVFAPEKGLLVPAKYTAEDQSGKAACKTRLLRTYGIQGNPYLCLMMCRLVDDKGLDDVLGVVHAIRDSGGFTLIAGRGDKTYEDRLAALTRADGALWLPKWPSPMQAIPMLAGADFYLSPSVAEPCGLMPMTACRYGAVPIVTLNGGLADNMDNEIAVIVGEDGLGGAVSRAAALYADKDALAAKRAACMARDFSWQTRKTGYLEVYAGE